MPSSHTLLVQRKTCGRSLRPNRSTLTRLGGSLAALPAAGTRLPGRLSCRSEHAISAQIKNALIDPHPPRIDNLPDCNTGRLATQPRVRPTRRLVRPAPRLRHRKHNNPSQWPAHPPDLRPPPAFFGEVAAASHPASAGLSRSYTSSDRAFDSRLAAAADPRGSPTGIPAMTLSAGWRQHVQDQSASGRLQMPPAPSSHARIAEDPRQAVPKRLMTATCLPTLRPRRPRAC